MWPLLTAIKLEHTQLRKKYSQMDIGLLLACLTLVIIGCIMIFSASNVTAFNLYDDSLYFFKKQITWFILGLFCLVIGVCIDIIKIKKYIPILWIISIISLILVLIPGVGINVKGASRWLGVGGFTFQPSETSKLVLLLVIGQLVGKKNFDPNNIKDIGRIFILSLPIIGLIAIEPDLSTAVVCFGIVFLLLFVRGLSYFYVFSLFVAGVLGIVIMILIEPFRLKRIEALFNPWDNMNTSAFQTVQGLLGIGTGGFWGRGIGNSLQKYFWVPEQHTDFIFSIIGEEMGFIGTTVVVLLFFILVWRCYKIGLVASSSLEKYFSFGVALMFFIQASINLLMVVGFLPVMGVPLPLISYGGTSLLVNMFAVGMVLGISKKSKICI